jgi:hypothetical protein
MPNYIIRVRAGRLREGVTDAVVGVMRASDQIDLFDKIDELTNPFDYEYWELPTRGISRMPNGTKDVPWTAFTQADYAAWLGPMADGMAA